MSSFENIPWFSFSFFTLLSVFLWFSQAATAPNLEGMVLCMVIPFVDCMCLVTFASGWSCG